MAKIGSGHGAPKVVDIYFQLIRNTTSPDEKDVGVSSYILNVPAKELLKLGTDDNLRVYIAEDNPRKRNRVHEAIRRTIEDNPRRFIVRNGGVVVTAFSAEVDDSKKTVRVTNASVINGAQTQGEIRRYINEFRDGDDDLPNDFHVRMELIVDPDPAEVVETAIARNTATPVKDISQAGGRGHLDDLEKSIQAMIPGMRIQKSETDVGCEDTRMILQKLRLLMPSSVSGSDFAAEKLRAYKNPAQCLSDFSAWYEARNTDPAAKRKYDFCVQMAPRAIAEYERWERHPAWKSKYIWENTKKGGRACRRDKANKIVWIAPGILFPIMGALSEFIVENDGVFSLEIPTQLDENKMIDRASKLFRAHNSSPMDMGRSEAAYDGLRFYTETLKELSDLMH